MAFTKRKVAERYVANTADYAHSEALAADALTCPACAWSARGARGVQPAHTCQAESQEHHRDPFARICRPYTYDRFSVLR